jgi:hypothetical protein
LLQCEIDDREVVGGGVGARVAGTQHAAQPLGAVVQVGQQRVKPTAALEGPGRAVLRGVRVTSVASMSIMIRVGAAPVFQAFARARARASRSASSS